MTDRGRPPVALVGLDSLQGLQVARIFARRGIDVHAFAKNPRYYSCRTRTVRTLTTCDTGDPSLLEHLCGVGRSLPAKAVLIACQDKAVTVLSNGRDQLEPWYHLVLPPASVVDQLINKAGFASYATSVGLPIPKTRVVTSQDATRRAAADLEFPVVVKPSVRTSEWMRHTKVKAIKVDAAPELLALCARLVGRVPELVVQDWLPGPASEHITCNVYLDRTSTTIGGFVSRKIRQWPPLVGQGCLAEMVDDEEAYEVTHGFFEAAGLVGFGYLEFKRRRGDGRLVAIEPNIGRPTGRSPLAEAAGIEFHYTAYADAAGLPLPTEHGPDGSQVKWMHELRDLQASLDAMRHGQLRVADWIRSMRGPKSYAVASWRDPMPFLAALAGGLAELRSPRSRAAP